MHLTEKMAFRVNNSLAATKNTRSAFLLAYMFSTYSNVFRFNGRVKLNHIRFMIKISYTFLGNITMA